MGLNIFWTEHAKSELNRIYIFYKDNSSLRVANNETKKIVKATIRLKKQPEIGQVEELLKSRSHKFHSLIHQAYKIIYWINRDENQIEIVDVFHTYQYPEKIKRTK